ncbi:cell surface protein [Alteribacillus sp. HJP-4]|uniref:cell surface protein n=1 Tax=Alteribacillus sp. HJP-4 TaxID=2775394 RepID=UPI0035CD35A5
MLMKVWKYFFIASFVFLFSFSGTQSVSAEHGDEDRDCGDFESGEEVMDFWEEHDYSADNDPSGLDRDGDDMPCEDLTAGMESSVDSNMDEGSDSESSSEDEAEESSSDSSEESSSDEEGDEMADTATNYPAMMLLGLIAAAGGGMWMLRRKSA